MGSPALVDLKNRIAANMLTVVQQAALVQALDAIEPTFPSPDELANGIAPVPEELLSREWFSSLYSIQAQAGSAPVVTSGAGNFVFQPGGVASGNIFTAWAPLAAALAALPGQKTVTLDTSLNGGNAVVPAGVWAGITDTTFVGGLGSPATADLRIFGTFPDARKLTFDNVTCDYRGVAAPMITPGAGLVCVVNLLNAAATRATGGQPIVALAAAAILESSSTGCQWSAGTIAVGAGCTAILNMTNGAALATAAVSGLGTLNLTYDGASQAFIDTTGQTAAVVNLQLLDPQPTFILRPGASGLLAANVFTTWAALAAAAAQSAGPVLVQIDGTLGVPHITAGTWNVNGWTFYAATNLTTALRTLVVDDGAHLTWDTLYIKGRLVISNRGATPTTTQSAAGQCFLSLDSGIVGDASSTQPFAEVAAGATLLVHMIGGSSLNGLAVGPVSAITTDVGGVLTVDDFDFGFVSAHALNVAGTATANVSSDATFNTPQDVTGALTTVFISKATQVAYSPAVLANWSGVAPTSTANALDRVAAKITPIP